MHVDAGQGRDPNYSMMSVMKVNLSLIHELVSSSQCLLSVVI